MPRETIRKLSDTTERLLVAGAHLAAGNADLARDKDALGKLIAKLGAKSPPVFAKLDAQIEKVLGAKPKEQASELVSLMMSLAQVRAGLAQLAPVAADEAELAPVPEIQTPCNAKDLYALHDALVTRGPGRMEKIDEAVERGDVADLRLVHAVVQAMGDPYVGDTVSDKVVPKFGRAIVEPVRKKLRFPGKKVDGRRLRALVAVEQHGARPLLEQAVREGSPEVREAALDAIADHMPGVPELEPIALAILAKERSGDVRRAAIRALGGYGSEASFTTLLAALDDERTVAAAAEALGKSKHPKVVDRLLERLAAADTVAREKIKKTDKAALKKQTAASEAAREILGALAEHADPRIPKVGRELLPTHGYLAARCIMSHGTIDDLRFVADLLEGKEMALFHVAVAAAKKLPADEAFERLSGVLRAEDRDSKIGAARVGAIWGEGFVPAGERWIGALLELAKEPKPPAGVLRALGATKDPRAADPLLAYFQKNAKSELAAEAIEGLAMLGDKRAIEPLLAVLKAESRLSWVAREALLDLADETTVDKVRTLYASLKEPEAWKNWSIRSVFRQLERKFPGH